MIKKVFTSIAGSATYVYILTIVAFYGYNSYFNIPDSFIAFSVKTPIIFFFDIARGVLIFLKSLSIWSWFGLIVFLIVLLILSEMYKLVRYLAYVGIIFLVCYLPFGFYKFGGFIGASTTSFYTVSEECIPGDSKFIYIAPTLFEGKLIFVPIDRNTRKLQNGLIVRESTNLTCQIEKKEIGKVLQ